MSSELEGKTSLVTGASAGLGVDFADRLAARGSDVIVVARRQDRLREVARDLMETHDVECDVVAMDLARPQAGDELYELVTDRDHQVDILVNNAGFGVWGEFLDADWESQQAMMNLNMLTPVRLTHLFAADMAQRGWGRLLQVGSIGAYQPTPYYSAYSASKSFLRSWAEGVDFELRKHGVSSTVINPGVTETEFFDAAGQTRRTWYQRLSMMD